MEQRPALPPVRAVPLLSLAALLLPLLILATRLATLLHEAAGHALIAALLGADVRGIAVSLFGGGWTSYEFAHEAAPSARALAAWGGIAVNLLTGAAALAFVRKRVGEAPAEPGFRVAHQEVRPPAVSLFLALFGGASLMGAVAYAALGLYYDTGDPVAWMDPPRSGGLSWIVFLAAAAAAAFLALRRYGAVQEVLCPSGVWEGASAPDDPGTECRGPKAPPTTAFRRLGIALATLGVATGAYAGLYALEGAPFVAADAATTAQRRAEREEMKRRFEEALARARIEHPGMSEAELRRLVEATHAPLRPGDVPSKFPLTPVLALLFAAGGAAGLATVRPSSGPPSRPPAIRAVALATALAALVLAALAWTPWKM